MKTVQISKSWISNTYCYVSNGVWQYGISFRYLITMYIDDLNNVLNSARTSCHWCTEHAFYVDDWCVIAYSLCWLQSLLNICSTFGFENDIYDPIQCMYGVIPRGVHLNWPYIYINFNKFEYVQIVKHTGWIVCNDMKDDDAILRYLHILPTTMCTHGFVGQCINVCITYTTY